MHHPRGSSALVIVLLFGLLAAACAPQATPVPTETSAPTAEATSMPTETSAPTAEATSTTEVAVATGDLPTLRMALLPVLDVLPFFIAQQNGYFTDEGINVELIPVSSALEREQLMSAGEVDGVLTDVIGPAITNAAATPSVKIVAMARRSYADAPVFRLLAGPSAGIETPEGLTGRTIGISENSVIQYLADRMLEQVGMSPDDVTYESIPAIPTRFTLMMEGQSDSAILPDPLAQAAIEAGAVLIMDDSMFAEQQLSQSVLSFRNDALEQQPDTVRAFLRAWNRAVEALNADPTSYRALWLENTSVPESVQDTYQIPPFPEGEITSEAVWDDVSNWLVGRGIIDQPAPYAESVDSSFLE